MKPSLADVRVLLVDDHAMVRLGFRHLLEGEGAIVAAEAADGESAVRRHGEANPDVVVMDVSMPGIGGLAALQRLLARDPKARVLMLSAHADDTVPARALKLGALGYLCKRATPERFLEAVALVAAGHRYLDPDLASGIALAQLSGAASPVEVLTDKELAVFLKLAEGCSVGQVASAFCLSASTVGTHLYHIKQKLNVANGAQLALVAVRNGLIET